MNPLTPYFHSSTNVQSPDFIGSVDYLDVTHPVLIAFAHFLRRLRQTLYFRQVSDQRMNWDERCRKEGGMKESMEEGRDVD